MSDTALVITAPEIDGILGELRMEHDPSARSGVPAHVTVLYPFLPSPEAEGAIESIRDLVASIRPFGYRFTKTGRFSQGILWLAPEPRERFDALLRALGERWPDLRPYGDRFAEFVPHCTVAGSSREADLDAIEATLLTKLPIDAYAREVALWREDDGTWSTVQTFALAGVA